MGLVRFFARRILLTIPVLVGMSVVVFLLLRLVPGDPAQVILGLRATPEGLAAVHRDLGLDLPWHRQYLHWVGNFLSGDLGQDYRSHIPVAVLLRQRLPVTLELAALSMLVSLCTAIPLGVAAAVRRGGAADRAAMLLGLAGISIPDFWPAIMLILFVALGLGVLPSSGFMPLTQNLVGNLRSMALPSLTLAAGLAAVLVRMTRASMLDVLSREYIKFARAKGLRNRVVVYRHALRNAAIPIITLLGLQSGYLLGGAVIVEQVFDLPGLGSLTVTATLERNYPVVQATALLIGLLFVVVNIATDLVYGALNPRIRVG